MPVVRWIIPLGEEVEVIDVRAGEPVARGFVVRGWRGVEGFVIHLDTGYILKMWPATGEVTEGVERHVIALEVPGSASVKVVDLREEPDMGTIAEGHILLERAEGEGVCVFLDTGYKVVFHNAIVSVEE